jgi:hypothetical protein
LYPVPTPANPTGKTYALKSKKKKRKTQNLQNKVLSLGVLAVDLANKGVRGKVGKRNELSLSFSVGH